MHSETDWLTKTDGGEGVADAYKFFMRPDPDMRDFLGPIEKIEDPLTGKEMRVRPAKVAMIRNAPEDKMRETLVYLDPLPHIRLDKAKPLQGWYQPATPESSRSRPRPCYTDAMLTEPYGGMCPVGCSFSLPALEPIETPYGPRAIETIRTGDWVWGRNQYGTVPALVTGYTTHMKPEGYVIVELFDGRQLRMTADHPIYSVDRKGWVDAGSLTTGEHLEEIRLSGNGAARSYWSQEHNTRAKISADGTLSCHGKESCTCHSRSKSPNDKDYEETGIRLSGNGAARSYWSQEAGREAFASEGTTQIRDNQAQNECSSASAISEHVSASVGTEITGMVLCAGGARPIRDQRVSSIEARCVYRSEGPQLSDAINVGDSPCTVAGPEGLRLGLRAIDDQAANREVLHSRLPSEGREVSGSEGIPRASRDGKDHGCSIHGLSDNSPRETSTDNARSPVVKSITEVNGAVRVYDIETATENFYHNGVLSHNCYINSGFRGYRGTGLMTVPINYGDQVRAQLKKNKAGAAGYFSSFSDPFLALEDYYHNTQGAAEAFHEVGLPVFFLSRLQYPGWALDLLQKNKYSYAQKSINTPDPDDWAKLSPGALPLMDHLDEIREMRRRGIYVSIQVNPIVPGIVNHDDVEHLFEMLAEAGANHVIVKFVEAGYSWAPAMVERIVHRFGDNRAAVFRDLFTQNIGGQKTVDQEYRLEGHNRYRRKAQSLGLTYAVCYEYRAVPGTAGVSLGREFMTSDQCHGQRVPMFSRLSTDVPFSEVEACPPSGCLTCAPDNEGEPRCGNSLMGEAKAMRAADYKQPII